MLARLLDPCESTEEKKFDHINRGKGGKITRRLFQSPASTYPLVAGSSIAVATIC